ncbi:hypothetical protein [Trinickia mobilis]|uniref:hypothetical protein n=1 Tax=Trinickia mobilis TaxID=2816356 RepID=UPI001A8C6332|nr:hypothetical protein [Trinickia mobilis]
MQMMKRVRPIVGVLRASLPSLLSVIESLGGFVAANAIVLLALAFIVTLGKSAPAVDSLPATARITFEVAERLGTLVVTLWMVWRGLFLFFAFGDHHDTRAWDLAIGIVQRVVLFVASLLAIRYFGSVIADTVAYMLANPGTSVATLLGIAVIAASYFLVPKVQSREVVGVAYRATGVAVAGRRMPRLAEDIRRTATHEAGHALLYAALPSLPDGFKVKVLESVAPSDEYRGFVRVDKFPSAATEGFLRWCMYLDLAGMAAELLACGDRADGARGDMSRWIAVARAYLLAGLGELFYADSGTPEHVAHNRLVLNTLRAEHEEALFEFFDANLDLLRELRDRLLEARELGADEVAPYLARVTFTSTVRRLRAEEV